MPLVSNGESNESRNSFYRTCNKYHHPRWLTLGKGLVPQTITTDDRGNGEESLFRSVAALGAGATFDISFRVVNVATSAVVLTSDCYRYTISQ